MKTTESIGLVCVNKDGKFWYFYPGTHTCNFSWLDTPDQATIVECAADALVREPNYYFENSDRMRMWLAGCRMVRAKRVETVVVTVLEGEGPPSTYPMINPDCPMDSAAAIWDWQDRQQYLAAATKQDELRRPPSPL